MEIDPISQVGGVVATSLGDFASLTHASLAHAAFVLAQAKEAESLAQRAIQENPATLAAAEQRQVPIDSQKVLPPHVQPEPPANEPGKGILIDVYE